MVRRAAELKILCFMLSLETCTAWRASAPKCVAPGSKRSAAVVNAVRLPGSASNAWRGSSYCPSARLTPSRHNAFASRP